jgi:hypothetical protein
MAHKGKFKGEVSCTISVNRAADIIAAHFNGPTGID